MKKFFRLFAISILSLGFLLPATSLEAKPRKKRRKTTQVHKRSKKRSKGRRQARTVHFESYREYNQSLDSLRLRNGGLKPIIADIQIPTAEVEPLTARFRRGDTTLTREAIKALYYGHQSKQGEGSFLGEIEQEVDIAIAQSKFTDALKDVQKGLWRNPMHFALIKRACDLSHHEKHPRTDIYVWQIVELFNVVESSGTGESPEKAYHVMSLSDALLYEMLWLDTPKEYLGTRKVDKLSEARQLLTLEVKDTSGMTKQRYYTMPIPL